MQKDKVKRPIGMSLDEGIVNFLTEKQYQFSKEHPTPEQVFLQEAVKCLTSKQRTVWEYHAYDQLTQDEIARKMKVSQPVIAKHIRACKRRIKRYCNAHMKTYNLIKSEIG